MVIVRFPDRVTEMKALGFLAGRFACRTWATGETMVPLEALAALALERFTYTVLGLATDEQLLPPVRVPTAVAV